MKQYLFKRKYTIKLFAMLLILFVSRMSFPLMKYVFASFFVFFAGYLSYGFLSGKLKRSNTQVSLIKKWWPVCLIVFFYFLGIFMTAFFHPDIFSKALIEQSFVMVDVIHILFYLIAAVFLSYFIVSALSFKYLIYKLSIYFTFLALLVAAFGLIKYILIVTGVGIGPLNNDFSTIANTSLLRDYNYYAFTLLLGAASFLYLVFIKKWPDIAYIKYAVLPLFFTCIMLSSSRRGIVVMFFGLLVILFFSFWPSDNYRKWRDLMRKSLLGIGMVILFFAAYVNFYRLHIETRYDNDRICEINKFAESFTAISSRYATLLKPELSYSDVHFGFWRCHEACKYELENDTVIGGRLERLKYTWTLFKDYSFSEKLIGRGFTYATDYALRFYSERKPLKFDYPHNFAFSALLYSGVLGLAAIFVFVIHLLMLLIKTKRHRLWFIFLIGLGAVFNLISGSSIFSVPIFFISFMLCIFNYHINHAPKNLIKNGQSS